MQVIRKRPGSPAELIEIENTLKALQSEVGGYIETVMFAEDATIICDEEGRIKGKPHNCNLCGVDFVGTILVAGVDGDEFWDVPQAALRIFPQKEKALTEAATSDVSTRPNYQLQDTAESGQCQDRDVLARMVLLQKRYQGLCGGPLVGVSTSYVQVTVDFFTRNFQTYEKEMFDSEEYPVRLTARYADTKFICLCKPEEVKRYVV